MFSRFGRSGECADALLHQAAQLLRMGPVELRTLEDAPEQLLDRRFGELPVGHRRQQHHLHQRGIAFGAGGACRLHGHAASLSGTGVPPTPGKSKRSRSSSCEGRTLPIAERMLCRRWGISACQAVEQLLHPLALEVLLAAAQVAGDDREPLRLGVAGDLRLRGVDQRPDHDVASVVGAEDGRHRLQRPGEEEVEEQRLRRVVAVVPEGDLVAAQLHRGVVEDASPEPRAHRALGLPRGGPFQNDGVGVLAQHPEGHRLAGEVLGQQMAGKAGMSLVQGHRQQLEAHRRTALQQAEQMKEGVRVLPSRHAHQDAVSLGDQAEIGDGPADVAEQALLQLCFLVQGRGILRTSAQKNDPLRPPGCG